MQRRISRRDALAGAAAGTAALVAAEPSAAAAGAPTVRGSWRITPELPPGAPPFTALAAFAAGGVFVSTGSDEPGTGIGSWKATGPRRFSFAYTNFHFDSNGRLSSIVDVTATGRFTRSSMTGTATLRRTDPTGAAIGSPRTSKFTGRRMPA